MVNIDDKTKKYRLSIGMYLDGRSNLNDDDVIKLCGELDKIGSEDDKIWALEQTAELHRRLKNYKKILPMYDKLITLYEKGKLKHVYYSARAEIYLRKKEYEKAFSDLSKAIRHHETFGNYIDRAKSLIGLKQYDEAKADLHKALGLLKSCHESVQNTEGAEIKDLLHQIDQKQHPKKSNQNKKTGLNKLMDFSKRLIGK